MNFKRIDKIQIIKTWNNTYKLYGTNTYNNFGYKFKNTSYLGKITYSKILKHHVFKNKILISLGQKSLKEIIHILKELDKTKVN